MTMRSVELQYISAAGKTGRCIIEVYHPASVCEVCVIVEPGENALLPAADNFEAIIPQAIVLLEFPTPAGIYWMFAHDTPIGMRFQMITFKYRSRPAFEFLHRSHPGGIVSDVRMRDVTNNDWAELRMRPNADGKPGAASVIV